MDADTFLFHVTDVVIHVMMYSLLSSWKQFIKSCLFLYLFGCCYCFYYVTLNMADALRLPYGLMGSYSLFGSDTFFFMKCFKSALFYVIIVARPISDFFVQP